MSAPSATQLYSSCMQAAGDLVSAIAAENRKDLPVEARANSNRANAQAVLALVQSAVTIHAASKTASQSRGSAYRATR